MNKIKPFLSKSGTDAMFQFFTGTLDLAYMGITPFLLGKSYGLPLKILGIAQEFRSSHGVNVLRSAVEKSDLRIGAVLGSTGHQLGASWSNLHPGNVLFVNLSPAEQLKALEFGFIDGVACWEPTLTLAERLGANRVYSASDDDVKGYNLIVAMADAVESKSGLIANFLSAHNEAIDIVNGGQLVSSIEYLVDVFDKEISSKHYVEIMSSAYYWPKCTGQVSKEDQQDIKTSLNASYKFLQNSALIGQADMDFGDCFLEAPIGEQSESEQLNIGYSESLMCAAYYLSHGLDLFQKHGLSVDTEERRLIERIAKLPAHHRKELSSIKNLIGHDPASAIVKAGITSEKLFNQVYLTIFSKEPGKVLAKNLAELEGENIVPVLIMSAAHWIRSMRNVAAHDLDEVSETNAYDVFERLVDIVEWTHSSQESIEAQANRCPKCNYVVETSWAICPRCTASLHSDCISCGKELQPEWAACPFCGSKQ